MEIGDSYREPRLPSKPKRDNIDSNERFTGTKEEREAERKFIKEEKEMAAKPDDILQDRATEKKNKKDRQQRSADKKVPNVKVLKSSDIIDISQEIMKRLNLSGAPAPIRDAWDEVSAVSEEENKRKKEWAARDAQKKKSEQMTLEGKPLFARKTEAETLFDKEQKRGYDKHQSDRAQAGKDALFPRYKKDEEGVPIDPDSLYDTDVGDKDIETFKASASDIIEYTGYIDNIMNKIDVATSSYDVQPAPKITPRPIDSRKGQKSKKKYYDPGIDTYDKSKMWSEPINPAKVPTSHAELIPQMPRNTTSEVSGNTASISYRPIKPKMTVSPELESERASEQMRRDIHNRGIEAKRKRKQAEQDKFDAENPPQGDAGHMYQL